LIAESGSVPWDASHNFSSSRWVEIRGPTFTLMTSEGKFKRLGGAVLGTAVLKGMDRLLR
jgi:hypothetical protein